MRGRREVPKARLSEAAMAAAVDAYLIFDRSGANSGQW